MSYTSAKTSKEIEFLMYNIFIEFTYYYYGTHIFVLECHATNIKWIIDTISLRYEMTLIRKDSPRIVIIWVFE